MTRTSVLSLRPALAVGIAVAAVTMLFLASHEQAQAGADPNSLSIDPALREVGVGATTTVKLVSVAPEESLAAWVVEVGFDNSVVRLNSCTSIGNPAGAIAVSFCEGRDDGGSPDDDTAVSGGAILFPSTERGIDGTNTLATISFDAVGAVGTCTDLTINVIDHLGPSSDAEDTNPTLAHGEICIVENPGVDRLWGDFDCNGDVDPIDALKLLRADSGLSVAQAPDCPAPGENVTVDGTNREWGDLDCTGGLDPIDALKTLRFDSGLAITQAAGCPEPDTEVSVS
ncbi:MAG TPA: hypothetical protein VMR52_07725 [Dehalococcoidia bacterium]|nr:hypothetical protein [Dehalococcoidia bacterium]